MKFSNKLKDTTLRYLILIISFYALIISSICFVNVMFLKNMSTDDCLWVNEFNGKTIQEGFFIINIIPDGVADKAGLKEGDILIEINKVKLSKNIDAMVLLNQYHGENIEYKILRNGREFVTKIFIYKYFNSNYLIYSILGFTFLIIGLLVGYSKPKENTSLLFYLLGTSASSGLLVYSGGIEIIQNTNIFLFISVIVFIVLFHPLFIHFFLTFPIKYNFKNRKKLLIILYIYAIILPIVQFAIRSTGNLSLMNIASMVVNISLGAYLIGGIVTFLISYIKIKDKIVKRPLKIIMYGFILGFVGFSYFFTFMLINKKPLFLINDTLLLPTILILVIPISFGYSIFKYKILDTEFIIKRGLIFGILTVTIGGIYFLLVFVLDSYLNNFIKGNRQLLTIGFIIMIIFIYDYLNKRTKDFVDKRFYKERYNYRQSLLDISKEIQSTKDIISTLKKLSDLIENKIGAESFVIWLKDEKYYKLLDDIHSPNQVYNKNKIDKITGEIIYKCIEFKNAPVIFNEIELANMNLTDEEINTLNSRKIMLAIPLRLKNSIIGCFVAGNKKSGRTYSTEDIDLLTTISSHVTIALENLKLQLEEIEKQKILEELEIAEDIQKSLLPSNNLAVNNLEISGVSIPAKSVGGDFFDYIHLSNNKLLVVVADVSGKGIPAALYMAKFQAVVQFASNIIENPGDILTELNNQIYSQLDRNYFITMCIAIFDFDKNVVSIYRAGHPPAIVITDDGINIVKTKGIGLGLEQDKIFKVNLEPSEFILNKNNIILLYSDGLTEAFNNKLNSYGIERTIDLLKQERTNNSKTILNDLIIDVNNFRNGAEQNDDITCVVIKIN